MPGGKGLHTQGCDRRVLEMYTLLAWVLFFATTFMAFVLGDNAKIEVSKSEKGQQLAPDGHASKTAVSSRMRLVFLVGLEGSGHHYFRGSFRDMFNENPEIEHLNECQLSSAYYITKSMTGSPSTYAEAHERARTEMRALALQGETVAPPGTLAFLTDGGCSMVGELSYPSFGGKDKVEQYIDVRMLAEMADAEGVDLRIVYLKRSAEDMVIADTQHRSFQDGLGGGSGATRGERYMTYMRILFTDIAAMHSGLTELGPGFVVCHDFGKLGDAEQATKIANFIAPSQEVANMTRDALVGAVKSSEDAKPDNVTFDDADVVIARLQEKLDVLEMSFC